MDGLEKSPGKPDPGTSEPSKIGDVAKRLAASMPTPQPYAVNPEPKAGPEMEPETITVEVPNDPETGKPATDKYKRPFDPEQHEVKDGVAVLTRNGNLKLRPDRPMKKGGKSGKPGRPAAPKKSLDEHRIPGTEPPGGEKKPDETPAAPSMASINIGNETFAGCIVEGIEIVTTGIWGEEFNLDGKTPGGLEKRPYLNRIFQSYLDVRLPGGGPTLPEISLILGLAIVYGPIVRKPTIKEKILMTFAPVIQWVQGLIWRLKNRGRPLPPPAKEASRDIRKERQEHVQQAS